MPPATRKSTSSTRGRPANTQQKLSFNHRVTKSVPKSAKESVAASPLRKELLRDKISSDLEDAKVEEPTPEPVQQIQKKPEESRAKKSDVELKAESVSDAAITRYWRKMESERMAKRVHQEDLSTGEKVLRYFDVSSQYGPCIGMPRIKRWKRAQMLGLNPPIEVLAVLMKEESKGNKGIERAHMDEIMNATVVGP